MSRGVFLGLLGGTAATGLALGRGSAWNRNRVLSAPTFSDYPFTLGFVRGDPIHMVPRPVSCCGRILRPIL